MVKQILFLFFELLTLDRQSRMKRPAVDRKNILRRPACRVAQEPRWQRLDEPVAVADPVAGPSCPTWAHHFCRVLTPQLLKLSERFGRSTLNISVWSDCCGQSTEMLSLEQIAEASAELHDLNFVFMMHAACDNNPVCKELTLRRHRPAHFSSDIYARDFETGEYECEVCADKHLMPVGSLDIYVCCFSCGPWSSLRASRADPAAKQCWYTMESIRHMQPGLFLCENVVGLAHGSPSRSSQHGDLGAIIAYFKTHLPNYHVSVVHGIDSTHFGFPQAKNRLLILGIRADQGSGRVLEQNLADLIAEPIEITHSWRSFLGLGNGILGLDRVGTVMKYEDWGPMQCTCSISPFTTCHVHPCSCQKCKGPNKLGCDWRARHHEFLEANCKGWVDRYKDKVTYMQIVDADRDAAGLRLCESPKKADPAAARQRNLLNILALMPHAQPLSTTYAICDISQSIRYTTLRTDGVCPTAASSAAMWSLRDACLLTGPQLAKLMGHRCAVFPGCSENQVKQLLGRSVHVATMGMGLMALICSLGDDATS